jgi:hypothetical protein
MAALKKVKDCTSRDSLITDVAEKSALFILKREKLPWTYMSGMQYELEGVISGPKRQGCQAYYTVPSTIEVRNRWGYTSALHYVFDRDV